MLASRLAEIQSEQFEAKSSESELNRTALKLMLTMVSAFYRDAIRYKLDFDKDTLINSEYMEFVEWLAERYNLDELGLKIKLIGESQDRINANVNQNLLITDVLYRII